MKSTKDILTELGACTEAVKWAGRKTPEKAWKKCGHGDWLLWIVGRLGVDRKTIVLAACACARTALKYVPAGEDRPRIAIETAEAWTRGEATMGQVRKAAHAATSAAYYAATDAAADAAYVATPAAYYAAADAAAHAATSAAYYAAADAAAHAATSAASAVNAAYAADCYATAHKQMADIVRKIIPFSVIKQAIAEYEGKA